MIYVKFKNWRRVVNIIYIFAAWGLVFSSFLFLFFNMDYLISIIKDKWPTAFIVIAVLVALYVFIKLIVKTTIWCNNYHTDIKSTQEKCDSLHETHVPEIKESIKGIQGTLTGLDKTVAVIEERIKSIWENKFAVSQSPMQLNELGTKILTDSGISEVIKPKLSSIIAKVKSASPSNAFLAQEAIKDALGELKEDTALLGVFQNMAFKVGHNVETILFVASIHFRDEILKELGFDKDDIDKHTPKQ